MKNIIILTILQPAARQLGHLDQGALLPRDGRARHQAATMHNCAVHTAWARTWPQRVPRQVLPGPAARTRTCARSAPRQCPAGRRHQPSNASSGAVSSQGATTLPRTVGLRSCRCHCRAARSARGPATRGHAAALCGAAKLPAGRARLAAERRVATWLPWPLAAPFSRSVWPLATGPRRPCPAGVPCRQPTAGSGRGRGEMKAHDRYPASASG